MSFHGNELLLIDTIQDDASGASGKVHPTRWYCEIKESRLIDIDDNIHWDIRNLSHTILAAQRKHHCNHPYEYAHFLHSPTKILHLVMHEHMISFLNTRICFWWKHLQCILSNNMVQNKPHPRIAVGQISFAPSRSSSMRQVGCLQYVHDPLGTVGI